jgi:predicted DNA-binding protein
MGFAMATMKGKRVLTSLYLDPPAAEALRGLSEETRIPQAVYLREAIEDLLAKYNVKMPKAKAAKR